MVFFTVRLHFPNSVYQDMYSYGFLMEGMVFGCELFLEEQFWWWGEGCDLWLTPEQGTPRAIKDKIFGPSGIHLRGIPLY